MKLAFARRAQVVCTRCGQWFKKSKGSHTVGKRVVALNSRTFTVGRTTGVNLANPCPACRRKLRERKSLKRNGGGKR